MQGPATDNEAGYFAGGGGHICDLMEYEFDEDTLEANARLIAAAPDAYMLIKRVATVLKASGGVVGKTLESELSEWLVKVDGGE
jgi:hypothetical protein